MTCISITIFSFLAKPPRLYNHRLPHYIVSFFHSTFLKDEYCVYITMINHLATELVQRMYAQRQGGGGLLQKLVEKHNDASACLPCDSH